MQKDIRHQHRNSILPLARMKRIMKIDDSVKDMMISAEVPALLAKATEIFCEELTLMAWAHTDESKRKTLQVCVVLHCPFNRSAAQRCRSSGGQLRAHGLPH